MATFSFAGETTPLRKTKRALLNGGGRYNAILSGQRWRPKLHLDGGAWNLRALVEQSSCPLLKAGYHGVGYTRGGNLSHRFS